MERELLLSALRVLAESALSASPLSSLFYAQLLYALDSKSEDGSYHLAAALHATDRTTEAVHTLSHSLHARPLYQSSPRAANLYASCNTRLHRPALALHALSHLAATPPASLLAPTPPHPSTLHFAFELTPLATQQLLLARTAHAAANHALAIATYTTIIQANPYCWEALEALADLGTPPNPLQLYPLRPASTPLPLPPLPSTSTLPVVPPPPLPLGPAQTSVFNTVAQQSKQRSAGPPPQTIENLATGEGLGFFTPPEAGNPNGSVRGKGALFGMGWTRHAKHGMSTDDITLDESSYESSLYPQPISALSYGQNNPESKLNNPPVAASGSFFTPPVVAQSTAGTKRTRGAVAATPVVEERPKETRRAVKGVPTATSTRKSSNVASSSSSATTEVRRSTRLSRDLSSIGLASSSTSSKSSSRIGATHPSVNPREKKRSKAGQGPAVLSDGGSDALSPRSRGFSSSPVPSSPGHPTSFSPNLSHTTHRQSIESTLAEPIRKVEEYIFDCLRGFGKAVCFGAAFLSKESLAALGDLPKEQQDGGSRCAILRGKAHFEMLNYEKAQKAFSHARQLSPHILVSMDIYSTLLWHLRLPTPLSFLAQELMLISSSSSSAWIAAGNVFSHLENHSAALKCFKRAAQVDEGCVYAYTLSGHECVVLEEWERALGFFREAVRRDKRHYNAWFGLGNVYMQTGKYRLAEYHFRKAVEINPTNAMLVCCVGSVLEKLGQRVEALEIYQKACVLAPDSPAVRFKRVRILVALKQYQLAETDLLHLKDKAPNEFNVNFLLGKLYLLLKRRTEAVKYFAFAQELDPRSAALLREQLENDLAGKEDEGEEGMEVDLSGQ